MERRQALRELRRAYAGTSRGVRAHVVARFLSTPMLPLLARLPPRARLLDLGGGHGAFSVLALAAGAERALVLEPDVAKPLAAVSVPRRVPALRFAAGYADALGGPRNEAFDAAVILDVLYRVPTHDWDAILVAAQRALAPGGVLLLKEIDPTVRWKALWNRAQEQAADLVGLTLGDAFSYEAPAPLVARLTRLGFAEVEALAIGRGYPHAHVAYVARRAR